MRKTIVVLSALLLTLTACGSDESEAQDNIRAALLDGSDLVGSELTEDEAGCVAEGIVDGLGVEKLRDYELIDADNQVNEDARPDDLAAEDAETLADTFVECVDASELLLQTMGEITQQLPDEQKDCIAEVLDEEVAQTLLAAQFRGENALTALPGDVQAELSDCVGTPAG
jgi:hypothetical protein